MNAAGRVIRQGDFFEGKISALEWDGMHVAMFALVCAVLLSALSVIYVTNENRLAFIALQQLDKKANSLRLHKGQLLLEQASLSNAERVAAMASHTLHMRLPRRGENYAIQL